jgi:transposase InsO family protein
MVSFELRVPLNVTILGRIRVERRKTAICRNLPASILYVSAKTISARGLFNRRIPCLNPTKLAFLEVSLPNNRPAWAFLDGKLCCQDQEMRDIASALDVLPVTIIVPPYNRAQLLREALTSLLERRRPAAQILVIDDGSNQSDRRLRQVRRRLAA